MIPQRYPAVEVFSIPVLSTIIFPKISSVLATDSSRLRRRQKDLDSGFLKEDIAVDTQLHHLHHRKTFPGSATRFCRVNSSGWQTACDQRASIDLVS
jgi:hypothetical protein